MKTGHTQLSGEKSKELSYKIPHILSEYCNLFLAQLPKIHTIVITILSCLKSISERASKKFLPLGQSLSGLSLKFSSILNMEQENAENG